jgi:hypothetical protein
MQARKLTKITLAIAGMSLCAAGLVTISGCAKPLLSPTDERTPFDHYDAVRAQYAPQYVENEFGRREPNLKGRLTPK